MFITTGFTDLSAEAHRNQSAALMVPSASSTLGVKGGVQNGYQLTITGPMTINIGPGRAVVPAESADDGAYVVTSTELEPATVEANNTSFYRRDLVVVQVDDEPPLDPESTEIPEGATIQIIKGSTATTAAGASVPATPVKSVALWSILLLPGDNASNGGFQGSTVADLRDELMLINQDRGPWAMAAGLSFVPMTNSTTGSVTVPFPAGRFSEAPIITCTKVASLTALASAVPYAVDVTETGFRLGVHVTTATSVDVPFFWTAVQMTKGAAAG